MLKRTILTLSFLTLIACGGPVDTGPDPAPSFDQRPPGDTCPACIPHINTCQLDLGDYGEGGTLKDIPCDPNDQTIFSYTMPDGSMVACGTGTCDVGSTCVIREGTPLGDLVGVCH